MKTLYTLLISLLVFSCSPNAPSNEIKVHYIVGAPQFFVDYTNSSHSISHDDGFGEWRKTVFINSDDSLSPSVFIRVVSLSEDRVFVKIFINNRLRYNESAIGSLTKIINP